MAGVGKALCLFSMPTDTVLPVFQGRSNRIAYAQSRCEQAKGLAFYGDFRYHILNASHKTLYAERVTKMGDYILSCCSTADLTAEHFRERDIHYICFHYTINGVQLPDDLGQSMPFETFYRKMAEGAETSTSQVNADEFEAYFTPFLEAGKDIVHVTLSSGISGVINSAVIAKENLEARFPGQKVYIVDSLGASSGYGLFMDKLADLRDGGMSAAELFNWAQAHKLELHHWFFSTDLSFYIKGGRISKTAGMFGRLLSICPLLNMDAQGRLVARAKVRTKHKVIREIVNRMVENALEGVDYSGKCYISQSACLEDAKAVAILVEANFPKLNGKVVINPIGTTIGSHTGPGTVALFFWGAKRG
jgi:DegV family protein with EDD domain